MLLSCWPYLKHITACFSKFSGLNLRRLSLNINLCKENDRSTSTDDKGQYEKFLRHELYINVFGGNS